MTNLRRCATLSRRLDGWTSGQLITREGDGMARPADRTTRNFLQAVDGGGDPDGTLSSWGTEASGYRSDHFYIGSSDSRGHSVNTQVPIPTNVYGDAAAMIQRGTFPSYRSMQDFVRDAIIHRLHTLAEMAPDVETQSALNEIVNMEILASQVEQHTRALEVMRSMVPKAKENLSLAAREQDWITLRKMLEALEDKVESFSEPWRGRLEAVIDEYREKLPAN